jgi:hypothetical protein
MCPPAEQVSSLPGRKEVHVLAVSRQHPHEGYVTPRRGTGHPCQFPRHLMPKHRFPLHDRPNGGMRNRTVVSTVRFLGRYTGAIRAGTQMNASRCQSCSFANELLSGRGSRFILGAESRTDRVSPKYGRQQALRCLRFLERATSFVILLLLRRAVKKLTGLSGPPRQFALACRTLRE